MKYEVSVGSRSYGSDNWVEALSSLAHLKHSIVQTGRATIRRTADGKVICVVDLDGIEGTPQP